MGRTGKPRKIQIRLTHADVKLIIEALPQDVAEARLKLLPKILREWGRIDLPRHLSLSLRAIRERTKTVDVLVDRARDLLKAINALDEPALLRVAHRIAVYETVNIEKTELDAARQDLDALRSLLIRLEASKPRVVQETKRGQPRNYSAHLVILDIAAMFDWVTETKATRQIDRSEPGAGDTGPFWEFAAAIWPVIFGDGTSGLSATMKNWPRYSKDYDEASALIANIALRHPSWGIFED